jgi:uncharacterized protein YggE
MIPQKTLFYLPLYSLLFNLALTTSGFCQMANEVSVTADAQVIIEPNAGLITALIEASDLKAVKAKHLADSTAEKINQALAKELTGKITRFNRDEKFSGATPQDITITSSSVVKVRKFIGIEITDLTSLAKAIDIVLANGAVISEVRIYPTSEEKLIASAIASATKAAHVKAEAAAAALGDKLGKAIAVTVTEEPEARTLRLEQQRGRTLEPLSDKQLYVFVNVRYELLPL